MKHFSSFFKLFCVVMTTVLVSTLLSVSALAANMRAGDGNDATGGATNSGSSVHNSGEGDTSAPGTGEFADDTSSEVGDKNSHGSPVESVIDGIVTDAEGAIDNTVSDMENTNMSVWGIVIAVIIIAAIVVLLFAFFSKRK